jgi:hypothetical protein
MTGTVFITKLLQVYSELLASDTMALVMPASGFNPLRSTEELTDATHPADRAYSLSKLNECGQLILKELAHNA